MQLRTVVTAACLILASAATPSRAQSTATTIKFDHSARTTASPNAIQGVTLSKGALFVVEIDNTCPGAFTYTVAGIPKEPPVQPTIRPNTPPPPPSPLQSQSLDPVGYDPQFGGY